MVGTVGCAGGRRHPSLSTGLACWKFGCALGPALNATRPEMAWRLGAAVHQANHNILLERHGHFCQHWVFTEFLLHPGRFWCPLGFTCYGSKCSGRCLLGARSVLSSTGILESVSVLFTLFNDPPHALEALPQQSTRQGCELTKTLGVENSESSQQLNTVLGEMSRLTNAHPNGSHDDASRPDFRPDSRQSTASVTSSVAHRRPSTADPLQRRPTLTEPQGITEWETAQILHEAHKHSHQSQSMDSTMRAQARLPLQQEGFHGYHSLEGQIPLPMQQLLQQTGVDSTQQPVQQALNPAIHQRTHSISVDGTMHEVSDSATAASKKRTIAPRKKKVQGPSQANGDELRRLRDENEGRELGEIARQVWHDEEGPKAEKSKQVFGMIWS